MSGIFNWFKKQKKEAPPYLERIDELEKLSIVRLKGEIDQSMIPVIEARIQANRRAGSKIDKNVVLDFSKVSHVDTATIAFHLYRLREYQEKGFKVGFMNLTGDMKVLLEMFKANETFKVFQSEEDAVREMNR